MNLRTLSARHRARATSFAVLAAAAHLAACASTPAPSTKAAATPAAASAPVVTMAPIPNPERAGAAHRTESAPAPRPRAAEPAPPTARHPSPPAAAPDHKAAAGADPARAARLRGRGLEALNRGAVSQAVALLSEAARLDPANALIRRDLERARRIDHAVHAPR